MGGGKSKRAVASQNGWWYVKTGDGMSKWWWAKMDGCEWKQVGEGENGGSGLKRVVAKRAVASRNRRERGENRGWGVEVGGSGSKWVGTSGGSRKERGSGVKWASMVLGWGSKWVGTAENGCGFQNGWGVINAVGQAGPGGVDRVVSMWLVCETMALCAICGRRWWHPQREVVMVAETGQTIWCLSGAVCCVFS
ncbi:hypothetical protein BYT27DRAFT_7216103 [Phlegmacium glaucopus]|nr:hypothetical protein BYT27DRAFT_7216103 [Phlegmacium glaucopus]